MGKRELVLVVGFLLLGVVVYQFTAPPPPPGSEGFSVGGLIRHIRRQVKGPRESASADSTQTLAVPAAIPTLRLNMSRVSDVTITGEDRDDIAATLHVTARGYDQAEANAAAKGPKIKLETSAEAVTASLDFASAPPIQGPQPPPMLSLTLLVPKRLTLQAEPHIGQFIVVNLAGAEIMSSRGETRVSRLTKELRLTHAGGALDISNVTALKLTTRGSRGTVKEVAGPVTIDATGGNLALAALTGPVEIEGRNTDFTLDADVRLEPELRINLTGGHLRVVGLRVATRIDGRNTEINVTLDAAAPLTIYNLGAITVTAPPGGYDFDASATEGRITSEDSAITATPSDGAEARANAKIRGGGPPLTLRATRGSIEVLRPAGK